jgi:peptidyl-prolyl cis-trans isomerase C
VSAVLTARAATAEENDPAARKVIARVNGEPIYEDQIKREVDKNLAALRRYGMPKKDDQLARRLQMRMLNQVIGNLLVDQASRTRTVENIDEKVEQRIVQLEDKYGHGAGMEKYLKLRRLTMDDLKKSLAVRVRLDEYLKEQGVLDPEIPEEKIREMYDADPESFSNRASVTASHILVAVDKDAEPDVKQQARQKAQQLRKELIAGKDFGELAKEHSDCATASRGGDLGVVRQGYMPAEFDKAAFALERGGLSEVVQTKHGFHIIRVADKVSSKQVPYGKMRAFLEKYLQKEESKVRLQAHILELRKKADIEILLQ